MSRTTCNDCLACEVAAMRRRHLLRARVDGGVAPSAAQADASRVFPSPCDVPTVLRSPTHKRTPQASDPRRPAHRGER